MSACDVYSRVASREATLARGRLQAVVADIALDAAETYEREPPGDAHAAMLGPAAPYSMRAVRFARETRDTMGEGIALLARARFERAAGYATSRTFAIEAAMTLARERDNIPLLAQAHTALGDEFVAVGAVERGLNRYRTMLDLTRPTEVPAIAHWAEVALIRASTR